MRKAISPPCRWLSLGRHSFPGRGASCGMGGVTAVGWSLFEDYEYRFEQIEKIEAWQEIHSYIREYIDKRYSGYKILSIDEISKPK